MREIQVNLTAIVDNYRKLKELASPAKVMAVVKANAYGHGMIEVAQALDEAGADYLGVADLSEALQLRTAGIRTKILAWIMEPDDLIAKASKNQIEIGVSNFEVLNDALAANARIHIKVDTGLGRGGFPKSQWSELFEKISGKKIAGLFSHLANTSSEEDLAQQRNFETAVELAKQVGVEIELRHLAASGATLSYPQMHYEMVRCGITVYGLNPDNRDMTGYGLRPAMRAVARVVNCKPVPAGQGVSYNYRYRTSKATHLTLVPFGYAEGMPRISEGHRVLIEGELFPVVGQVAMDQIIVETGDRYFAPGTEVVVFGDPAKGEPSAEALGASARTINYEVVTRVGGRAKRVFLRGQ